MKWKVFAGWKDKSWDFETDSYQELISFLKRQDIDFLIGCRVTKWPGERWALNYSVDPCGSPRGWELKLAS